MGNGEDRARRAVGETDVDDRLVVDEVQLLNGGRVDRALQDFLQAGTQFRVARDGAVQDDRLVAVRRQDPGWSPTNITSRIRAIRDSGSHTGSIPSPAMRPIASAEK